MCSFCKPVKIKICFEIFLWKILNLKMRAAYTRVLHGPLFLQFYGKIMPLLDRHLAYNCFLSLFRDFFESSLLEGIRKLFCRQQKVKSPVKTMRYRSSKSLGKVKNEMKLLESEFFLLENINLIVARQKEAFRLIFWLCPINNQTITC